MIKLICSTIGITIIACLNTEISADTRILAIAILMCGYIACKDD